MGINSCAVGRGRLLFTSLDREPIRIIDLILYPRRRLLCLHHYFVYVVCAPQRRDLFPRILRFPALPYRHLALYPCVFVHSLQVNNRR